MGRRAPDARAQEMEAAMRRAIVWTLMGVLLAASLAGCGVANETKSAQGDSAGAAPPLTQDNLPTKVGLKWTTTGSSEGPTKIDMKVDGPWSFSDEPGWDVDNFEIVDPMTVPGIDKFSDVTFVTKSTNPDSPDYYYPRGVTDEWVDHLGRIEVDGKTVKAEPKNPPQHFWPLNFEVGQTYEVSDTEASTIRATVLARNTLTVPAGKIDNAYLVRFEYASKTDGKKSTYYYLFAPNVGFCALIHPSAGSEESGFTEAKSVDLLATMPK